MNRIRLTLILSFLVNITIAQASEHPNDFYVTSLSMEATSGVNWTGNQFPTGTLTDALHWLDSRPGDGNVEYPVLPTITFQLPPETQNYEIHLTHSLPSISRRVAISGSVNGHRIIMDGSAVTDYSICFNMGPYQSDASVEHPRPGSVSSFHIKNFATGISVSGGKEFEIRDNWVEGAVMGIFSGGTYNEISGNKVFNGVDGIRMIGTGASIEASNVIYGMSGKGIITEKAAPVITYFGFNWDIGKYEVKGTGSSPGDMIHLFYTNEKESILEELSNKIVSSNNTWTIELDHIGNKYGGLIAFSMYTGNIDGNGNHIDSYSQITSQLSNFVPVGKGYGSGRILTLCSGAPVAVYYKYGAQNVKWFKNGVKVGEGNPLFYTFESQKNYRYEDFEIEDDEHGPSNRNIASYIVLGSVNPSFKLDKLILQENVEALHAILTAVDPAITGTDYIYNWGDNSTPVYTTSTSATKSQYSTAGSYEVTVKALNTSLNPFFPESYRYCPTYATKEVKVYSPFCTMVLNSAKNGEVKINRISGAVVYNNGFCDENVILSCIPGFPQPRTLKIISSSAATFSDDWLNDLTIRGNDYETGKKGMWRNEKVFGYKEVITARNTGSGIYNYNAGTYDFVIFDWEDPVSNGVKWINTSTVEEYSPDGNAIQENNPLNIRSVAKYGYHNSLPYLTGQLKDENASNAFLFESFENDYSSPSRFEDDLPFRSSEVEIEESIVHSGKRSVKINGGVFNLKSFSKNPFQSHGGISVKFWVRSSAADISSLISLKLGSLIINPANVNSYNGHFHVSRTGEWILVDILVNNLSSVSATFTPQIQYAGTGELYIDDIRIQPMESKMISYVYDNNTLKLLTQFDDQNFGLYYQYNGEGKLVRKQIETERGIKTVQETQYHTPEVTAE